MSGVDFADPRHQFVQLLFEMCRAPDRVLVFGVQILEHAVLAPGKVEVDHGLECIVRPESDHQGLDSVALARLALLCAFVTKRLGCNELSVLWIPISPEDHPSRDLVGMADNEPP